MADFHIVHFIPTERHHGLKGYQEVIDTVTWGLRSLGHNVTYAVNFVASNARNIVFGSQLLLMDSLKDLPPDTILYNLEQRRDLEGRRQALGYGDIPEDYYYQARNFTIWDYSTANIPFWQRLAPGGRVKHVPIGYAPGLTRIAKPEVQDIDVLIYGKPTDERLSVFQDICEAGLRSIFVCGLYGSERDGLIARSKIVLNISQYDKIFEIVRVSYLLANRKAVVADFDEQTLVEGDIVPAVRFARREKLADACRSLLADDRERERLEAEGFEIITRRDIRGFLALALADE